VEVVDTVVEVEEEEEDAGELERVTVWRGAVVDTGVETGGFVSV
jgi:hypothetical protein